VLWLIAFAVCFVEVVQSKTRLPIFPDPSSLLIFLDHTAALLELIANAIGGSSMFPILHVALFSIFKSKRNPSTRRRILIGWSLLVIAVKLIAILTAAPKVSS
jgi:hypothetical protein